MNRAYLYVAISVSGASVLAVEILGTRIIGPFFGVDIFLWSALIAVTLAALAAGYWLGGLWADRRPSPGRFAALFVAAGVYIAATPILRGPVAAAAGSLGRFAGMSAASFALFFPPLAILGMVSPYALKLRAGSLGEVGRSAGDLYAISTVASVAAALLTGFVLIPSFGVRSLTTAIGLALAATGVAGLLAYGNRRLAGAPDSEAARSNPRAPERSCGDAAPFWCVSLAVAAAGACVLAVEILGSRLLAPYYGSSLYLWSALIGVALLALSLGYWIGGRYADRGPTLPRFCALFAAAGLWTAAIPWLRGPLLAAADPLGLRGAVLAVSAALFLPPLALLGMTSPYAVRLAAADLGRLGRTAGRLSAVSTIAGMAAAVGTALLLVPAVGSERSMFLAGFVLVATALALAALRRRARIPALLALAAAAAAAVSANPNRRPDPDAGLLAIEHTPYGEIRIVTMDGLRLMLIDGMVHTETDSLTLAAPSDYVSVLDLAGDMFSEPGRMLLVGLGGGAVAKRYASRGWNVDAVEIDPAVTRAAIDYFGLTPSDARVFHMDGREFLAKSDTPYDLIIADAFGGSSIPFHLVTKEAFGLFKSRLAPGGAIAMNVIAVGWDNPLVRSLAATLSGQFEYVSVLPMAEPPDQLGNLILLASDREIALIEEPPVPFDRFSLEYRRVHAWDNRFAVDPRGVRVITDDWNPADLWAEHINLEIRKGLHEYFGASGVGW
jgi:spermidine synthase